VDECHPLGGGRCRCFGGGGGGGGKGSGRGGGGGGGVRSRGGHQRQRGAHGKPQSGAVQVDPIKPTLKEPGTKPLKLKYNDLLSSFAFEGNLRRYMKEAEEDAEWSQLDALAERMAAPAAAPATPGRGLPSLTSKLNLRTFGDTPLS